MVLELEEDPITYSDSDLDEERGRKYSSSSESDVTTVLIQPRKEMKGHPGDSKIDGPSPAQTMADLSEIGAKPECLSCKSSQSLVGSAHIQLQLVVDEVTVEVKDIDINQNGTGNIQTSLKTDMSLFATKKDEADSNNEVGNGEKKKAARTGWRRYIGIMLAISSSMLFALAILIVKSLPQYHPYSVSFWRFQGVLWPTLPILLYFWLVKKQNVFGTIFPLTAPGNSKTLFLLFLRGVSGATAVVLQFYSLQFISMADSSVIAFSTPVFVSLASHFILGEKSGFVPILCGIVTLGGVVVITRPPILTGGESFDSDTLIGSGLAFGCMFLAATTFLLLRYLRQMHYAVITVFFGFWGSFQSLALSATLARPQIIQLPEGLDHWLLAVALALLTFVAQSFIVLAFKYEQAGTVSLCRTCDILFAYVWQFVFLGQVPDLFSIIGGLIVIFGVVVAALRKFLTDLPDGSPAKKRFWILLT